MTTPAPSALAPPDRAILRVLLVDDHEMFRRRLREFLEEVQDIHVLAEAEDGRAAVRLAGELEPDAVVIDVAMPGLNGIEATRLITASRPSVRVVALSMHGERGFVDGMLAAGAAGYVLKENAFSQLVRALRVVTDGGTYLCDTLA
ncbi:MAG: response regulator transcription factor [Phycisphaerales bacterium]|nr:response regulator transcription factor [Phycisphaerales bacterium]